MSPIHLPRVAPSRLARLLAWLPLDKLLPWLVEDRGCTEEIAREAGRKLLDSEAQYRQILDRLVRNATGDARDVAPSPTRCPLICAPISWPSVVALAIGRLTWSLAPDRNMRW